MANVYIVQVTISIKAQGSSDAEGIANRIDKKIKELTDGDADVLFRSFPTTPDIFNSIK